MEMKQKIILIIDRAVILFIQGVFFLVPLYFSFFYKDFSVFSLDKTVLFKILIDILLILTLIKLVIAKEIAGLLKLKHAFFYLPFFLILIITTFFSTDISNSLTGSYWRQQGLATYLYFLFFIGILLLTINNKNQVNKIINALLFSSLIISLYGICQWLGLDSFPWQKAVPAGGRVISTFGQPVFLGNYLLLVIFLTIYKFITAVSFYKRFLFVLLFVSQLLCLVFTYTRGAWIGFAAGTLLILFAIFRNYLPSGLSTKASASVEAFPKGDKFRKVFVLSAVLLILFLLFLSSYNNFFTSRIKSITDFGSGSIALRLKYWDAGLKAISERPLAGYGLDNQQQVILKYYDSTWSIFETIGSSPDRLHNELLDFGAQGGIGLALSYLFILFYLFFKAIRLLPKLNKQDRWLLIALLTGVFSYQIALLSSFSTIDTNPIFWAYTVLILIIINGRGFEKDNDNSSLKWNKQINLVLAVFVILIIMSLIFLIKKDIDKIKADYYFRLARVAYAEEDYLIMVNNYLKVFNYNPQENFYSWFFANDIEAALKNIESQNFKKTILIYMENYLANNQSATDNYAELLKRAKIYTMLGYYENHDYFTEAEKIYDELVRFNPFIFDNYSAWAREAIYKGDYSKALTLYNKALATIPATDNPKINETHRQELNQAAADAYKSMAYCHKELGQGQEQRMAYEKILKLDPYRLDIYDLLALSYYQSGEIDQAIRYNHRGLTLDVKNYHWPLALSLLYREKKDLTRAKEYLDQALKLAPENQDLKKYYEEINK